MRQFIRCVMVLLRALSQDNYSEETKEQNGISMAAMKTAKVIPGGFQEEEEDRAVLNQVKVKDIDLVQVFNSEDENSQNVRIANKYEYYLRDNDYEEEVDVDGEGFKSVCIMKSSLFEKGELFEIINDEILLQRLDRIIFYETLHGPEPKLPFNLESFLQFLFIESRDLKLIRVMLRICQRFPIILIKYDQRLKAQGSETGMRDNLMLKFLVNVQDLDKIAVRITIKLMGFRNIIQLMRYYEDYSPNDPIIMDAMIKLEQASCKTNNVFDQNTNDNNYEYIY